MFNPKFTFFLVLTGLLIYACKSDPEPVESADEPILESALSDTIFGELSEKQQYFQHFILQIPSSYQQGIDSLSDWIIQNEPGGLQFINWEQDSVTRLKMKLDTHDIIQPFYYANYFEQLGLTEYPYWDASESNRNLKWTKVFQNDQIGMVDFNENFGETAEFKSWIEDWKDTTGVVFITNHFQDQNVKEQYERFQTALRSSANAVQLELMHFDTVQLEGFRDLHKYRGHFVVRTNQASINDQLNGGADFILLDLESNGLKEIPFEDWSSPLEDGAFEKSTRRILSSKSNLKESSPKGGLLEQVNAVQLNLLYGANALLQNGSDNIPLTEGIKVYSEDKIALNSVLRADNKIKIYQKEVEKTLSDIAKNDGHSIFFLPDSISEEVKTQVKDFTSDQHIIVCFSNPELYPEIAETPNLVYFNKNADNNTDYAILMQQLTGQLAFDANFVLEDSIYAGIKTKKIRLARTQPEFVGLSSDTLRKIDWAVNSALNGRAFPGCQVLIAKEGCIIYDKSFGFHTYDRVKPVTSTSVYDLASLTKVVSTTMVGMKLFEMDAYGLNDSLGKYLPDSLKNHLPYPSTIRNITFNELFIHKSGMPAGFPVIRYMQYTSEEIGRFDKYYCDLADSIYTIEVAENFYLDIAYKDSMWIKLNQIWLDKSKPYKYSDVNMNTLYFIFKSIIQNSPKDYGYTLKKDELVTRDLYVEFLYDTYYNALGMERTKYKPLRYFDKNEIVPTEKESYWRKQLLQGHVHDPNAALYGGVAGNAGIFSTTNDLAILGEMLLRKGMYNGKKYLNPETITKFTSAQPGSHRGLGFNKPSLNTSAFGCADDAAIETYGHTGFTGTCIWVDPVNELTYVFLSNRVHPKVNNRIYQHGIRGRVHQFAYDAALF